MRPVIRDPAALIMGNTMKCPNAQMLAQILKTPSSDWYGNIPKPKVNS